MTGWRLVAWLVVLAVLLAMEGFLGGYGFGIITQ